MDQRPQERIAAGVVSGAQDGNLAPGLIGVEQFAVDAVERQRCYWSQRRAISHTGGATWMMLITPCWLNMMLKLSSRPSSS